MPKQLERSHQRESLFAQLLGISDYRNRRLISHYAAL
jgi:hypothetical protein